MTTETGSIVKLVTAAAPTEAQQQSVDALREALAMAERGEFLGVAIVGQLKDSSTYTFSTAAESKHVIVGGLSKLIHRIHETG